MAREFPVNIPISATNKTGQATSRVEKNITRLEKRLNRLNKVGAKFDRVGRTFTSAGRRMVTTGVVVGGGLALMVNQAAKFESRFGRIATLIEGDARDALNMFGADIRALSIASGKGLGSLQDSLFDIISAGVPVGDSMEFLRKATFSAVGGFAKVETVVDGTTAILNAYEKPASKILQITDQISIANEVGKTTFEKLSSSVGQVAASTAQMGVSSGEMLASLAAVTKVTGRTEEAVTGLNALMTLIANPTEDAAKELDRLNKGLSGPNKLIFSISRLQDEGLLKFFNKLIKVTKGDSESINKLTGSNIRASRFLRTLISQADTFNKTAIRMGATTDKGTITINNFNNAAKTMAVRLARVRARIVDAATTLGTDLFPLIEEFEPKVTGFLKAGAKWVKENRAQAKSIVENFAKVSVGLIGAGGISFALGIVTTGVGRLALGIRGLGKAMTFLAKHPLLIALTAFIGVVAFSVKKLRDMSREQEKLGKTNKAVQTFNKNSIKNQARLAQGLPGLKPSDPKQVFNIPGLKPELPGKKFKTKEQAILSAQLRGRGNAALDQVFKEQKRLQAEILKNAEDFQKKLTKITDRGTEDRINIFAKSAKGENLTRQFIGEPTGKTDGGFAAEEIKKAIRSTPRAQDNRRIVQVDRIELNNVADVGEFLFELDKLSVSPGVDLNTKGA